MPELTERQIMALQLTHRGKRTLAVRQAETLNQPADIQMAISELPHLAQLGLMSIEWLNDTDFICRITSDGLAALSASQSTSREGESE